MAWELLMQLPAGSGLPFGTASSRRSIIRRWTGHNSVTCSISSPTAKAFFTTKSVISNPSWNACRITAWDTAVRIRSSRALCHCQRDHRRPAFGLRSSTHQVNRRRVIPLQAAALRAVRTSFQVGGRDNNGYVARVAGRTVLIAEKKGTWLALAATVPFSRVSCGYVGRSDGWTDLAGNFQWTGSSITPPTATSHSRENWI